MARQTVIKTRASIPGKLGALRKRRVGRPRKRGPKRKRVRPTQKVARAKKKKAVAALKAQLPVRNGLYRVALYMPRELYKQLKIAAIERDAVVDEMRKLVPVWPGGVDGTRGASGLVIAVLQAYFDHAVDQLAQAGKPQVGGQVGGQQQQEDDVVGSAGGAVGGLAGGAA